MTGYIKFIIALAGVMVLAFTALPAQAQNAIAGAAAQSQSGSLSQSGASSNNQIIFPSTPRTTEADVTTVPSVYAPSVSGGAHPCLAGGSGGISVLGGGISGGASTAEHVCMLAWLGQPEAAIRALAMSSPRACRALNNVGYYVVPGANNKQKIVPFKCEDQTKRGGAYTSGVSTTTVSTNSGLATRPQARPDVPWHECRKTSGNGVKIKYKYGVDKAAAKSRCLLTLGY